jgi:hypothetical protein
MVLARTLTFGGAVALATASVSPWFGYDYKNACGWTCYSPLSDSDLRGLGSGQLHAFFSPLPTTAYDGLGTWVAVVLVLVVLGALLAVGLHAVGRQVPRVLAALTAAGAVTILVRVVTQPDIGPGHTPNGSVAVEAAAYAGTAGAIVAALGVIRLATRRH